MSDQLQQAVELHLNGHQAESRKLLAELVSHEPENIQAWIWLARVIDEPEKKRFCLERALNLQPGNPEALAAFQALQPRSGSFQGGIQPAAGEPAVYLEQPSGVEGTPKGEGFEPKQDVSWPGSQETTPEEDSHYPEDEEPLDRPMGKVFANLSTRTNRFVLIEPGHLLIANPKRDKLFSLVDAIQAGDFHPSQLDRKTVIPISNILQITTPARGTTMTIRFLEGRAPLQRLRLIWIEFAGVLERDSFLETIQEKLGPDYIIKMNVTTRLQASLLPGAAILAVIAVTSLLISKANSLGPDGEFFQFEGPLAPIGVLANMLLKFIGPFGFFVIGALIAIGLFAWGSRRVNNPPVTLSLSLDGKHPGSTHRSSIIQTQLSREQIINIAVVPILLGLALLLVGSVGVVIFLQSGGADAILQKGTMLDLRGQGLTRLSFENVDRSRVIVMDLSGNRLAAIPAEIGEFTNLEYLYIQENQLTTLPKEIGELKKLKWLSLENNQLAELPVEITGLSSLTHLYLKGNQLTGLPQGIEQLNNLQVLDLQHNPIQSLPPALAEKGGLEIKMDRP